MRSHSARLCLVLLVSSRRFFTILSATICFTLWMSMNVHDSSAAETCFLSVGGITTGDAPHHVIAHDMNGDGVPDLVVANHLANTVGVHLGLGGGVYAAALSFTVGSGPTSVFATDFDGDGDVDLCVANRNGTSVSVLLSDGAGGFSHSEYIVGANPFCAVAGDFDLDGDQDIVFILLYVGTVGTLVNDGSGSFVLGPTSIAGAGPHWISAADLDLDGDLDLAVANHLSNNVSILYNDGSGTFSSPVDFSTGNYAFSTEVADVNGDGFVDVIVPNAHDHNVTVLLNDGNGQFSVTVNYSVGVNPWFASVADFDDDGDNDIAVSNSGDDNVSILENVGGMAFTTSVTIPVGDSPGSLSARDLDADGDIDLTIANVEGDNLTVMLNSLVVHETFCEGFESDSPGNLPSCLWVPTGNVGGIVVDNGFANSGSNSLKLVGELGGCWSAEPSRAFAGFPISVSISLFNGDEVLSGCHQFRGGLGVNSVPVPGTGPGTSPFNFLANGDLEIAFVAARPSFSGFALGVWHDIQCYLWIPGDGFLHLRIWANGRFLGEYSTPEEAWMSGGGYINLSCGEGSAWFDDLCVMAINQCVPDTVTVVVTDTLCQAVSACGTSQEDVNNDGNPDIVDVVKVVDAAFRGKEPTPDSCNAVATP